MPIGHNIQPKRMLSLLGLMLFSRYAVLGRLDLFTQNFHNLIFISRFTFNYLFQVFLKIQEKNCEKVQLVKLSMIDLAGSERGAATNCKGLRFKEGASINKSLLALGMFCVKVKVIIVLIIFYSLSVASVLFLFVRLGNCINSLADGVSYIPYRSSRLTRLLKDSLGGNCQTAMVACVGPTVLSYEDTYNTLKYAARASTIKTKVCFLNIGIIL